MSSNGSSNSNSNGQNDVLFSYTSAVPGVDLISDASMAEIFRRAQAVVGGGVTGAIYYGSVPPQDKSLLWGSSKDNLIYRYNPSTGKWVSTDQAKVTGFPGTSTADGQAIILRSDGIYSTQTYGRVVRYTHIVAAVTQSTFDITIDPDFNTTDYSISCEPNYDNEIRWWVTSKGRNRCTIVFEDPGWVTSGDPTTAIFTLTEIANPS